MKPEPYTCAFCGDGVPPKPGKKEACVTLRRYFLDLQGNQASNGSVSFDLCDECEEKVSDSLTGMIDENYGNG